jgi:hypothetical protein
MTSNNPAEAGSSRLQNWRFLEHTTDKNHLMLLE